MGWPARLYDLPPPSARLAHTEVVNLHPALPLCPRRLFLSSLACPPVPPPLVRHPLPRSTTLDPTARHPLAHDPSSSRTDTSNAPALSHRLSDTHARHRCRWDTSTFYLHIHTRVHRRAITRTPTYLVRARERRARARAHTHTHTRSHTGHGRACLHATRVHARVLARACTRLDARVYTISLS